MCALSRGIIIILVLVSYLDSHTTGTLRAGALSLGSSSDLLRVALDPGFDPDTPACSSSSASHYCRITLPDENHGISTSIASKAQSIPFSHPTTLLILQCEYFQISP